MSVAQTLPVDTMRAVELVRTGGPDVLNLGQVAAPRLSPGSVMIEVHATALNHADLLQRRGTYGGGISLPTILGIECSGIIVDMASDVKGWNIGDRVCALINGGGYADLVCVPASLVLPVPANIDLITAAALPEAACTVWSNIIDIARFAPGDTLLVHGGAGGIGSFAIQAGRARGARIFATAGGHEKMEYCRSIGADRPIDYRNEDFVSVIIDETGGRGADIILDNMGGLYLDRNIDAMAHDGRIVMIGLQGGREANIHLGKMMGKRGSLFTTSLRDRPVEDKARIVSGVLKDFWPDVETGRIRPLIDREFPLSDAAGAHSYMESGQHVGKIVLRVRGDADRNAKG